MADDALLQRFVSGSLVEAHGLKGAAQLNGQRGTVNGRVQSGRIGVDFPQPGGTKALRADNLSVLRVGAEDAPMPQLFQSPDPSGNAHRFRILAFGDSLTAGSYMNGTCFEAYTMSLIDGLLPSVMADVWVCGLSGLTAEELVDMADDGKISDYAGRTGRGLSLILAERGPFDIALVMAGTNDLGDPGADAASIFEHIRGIHAICHRRGVRTISLSVPPNGALLESDMVAYQRRWTKINDLLRSWARDKKAPDGVVLHIDTSQLVPYDSGNLFDPDKLHFSKAGSRQLGARLAPLVAPVLQQGSKDESASTSSAQEGDCPMVSE